MCEVIGIMLSWKLVVFVLELEGNRESQSVGMGNASSVSDSDGRDNVQRF